MMKKFNLKEFQSGILGLTEDLRTVRFIYTNYEGGEYQKLIAIIEGEHIPYCFSLEGKFAKDKHHLDIVYMKSRHQELIDSYNPQDTWQVSCLNDFSIGVWISCVGEPKWSEDCEYRIHPHNELIKAWKAGIKISEVTTVNVYEDRYPTQPFLGFEGGKPIYDNRYAREPISVLVERQKLIPVDSPDWDDPNKKFTANLPKGFIPFDRNTPADIKDNDIIRVIDKSGSITAEAGRPAGIFSDMFKDGKIVAYKILKRFSHPEWHDLEKYPAPEWAKYRVQDENGSVYDFPSLPCLDDDYTWRRNKDGLHAINGDFKPNARWKDTLVSIDELRAKQKPQSPTLPEGFTPYESYEKAGISENDLVQFIDKLGNISEPEIFSKSFIGKDVVGYRILETQTKPTQDQSTDDNEFEYPIYKRSKSTGVVVEFTDLCVGKVISAFDSGYEVGKVDDCWVRHTVADHWQDCETLPERLTEPTITTPFPTLPFSLTCGDKPEVCQWLKDNGCVWTAGQDLTQYLKTRKRLYVNNNKFVNWGFGDFPEFDPFNQSQPTNDLSCDAKFYQEQIDKLKAQVNCLRDAALDAISFMPGGEAKAKLRDAYDATQEQCLSDVKVKAIESVREQIGLLQRYSFLALHQNPSVTKMPDQSGRWIDRDAVDDLIEKHINSLLEQAR